MNRQFRMLIALALVIAAAYIADIPLPVPAQEKPLDSETWYRVVRVTDGDTIVIERDGEELPVRLIGIDSPEVETPYTRAECFGTEASAAANQVIGTDVRLEIDPSQDLYDTYGRLLAYVYVPASSTREGILVNKYMIAQGFAREYTFDSRYAHQQEFKAAEAEARAAKRGMWSGACTARR